MARIIPLSFLLSSVSALSTCYYPNGGTESNHVPCNQTISGGSACCDPLDACSTSGICLGRTGWDYRGSCTDQTWSSANCPAQQWPQCTTDPSTNKPYESWTAIWSCSPVGTPIDEQCCSYSNGTACCNSKFQLRSTGSAFKPGYDAMLQNFTNALANATAHAASSSSSTNSSQSSNCTITRLGNDNLGAKVGAGVGVPLGVLVAGLLGFLFYREHKKGSSAKGAAKGVPTREISSQHPMMDTQNQAPNYNGYAQDNGYAQQTPPQQYSPQVQKSNPCPAAAPVYEAPAGNNVHEMGHQ